MPGTTLGRGLSSLIPGADAKNYWGKADQKAAVAGERIERIPVARIVANPQQPRERFERQGMEDLVASIKQHGILQPLVVTETPRGYELIAGERRLRAAKLANLRDVPAIVRSATNQEKLELALVENLQRRDLNPVERARGYQRMVDEFNLTQDEVAKKVGQSRPVVANGMRILHLPPEMLAALSDGKIAEGHAKVLLGITDQKARQQLFKKMLEEHLSVRAVEDQSTQVRGHKRRAPASAELKAKASRIEGVLGAKVVLKPSGKGGKIVIDYNDAEELEGIVRKVEGRG